MDHPLNPVPGEQTEMASVLFMDMVRFSTMPMEQQRAYLSEMQSLVSEAAQVKIADQEQSIVKLPTGDGMALVFFGDPTRAAECAVEVAAAIKKRPHLQVRMGLHIGPVYRVADINRNLNVSGGGINMCQRVMDGGDAGHILVSGTMHEVLKELGRWRPYLKDLGEHEIKHGLRLHFYNLCTEGVGNPETPVKWRSSQPVKRATNWLLLLIAALVLGAIGVVAMLTIPRPSPAPKLELSYSILVQPFKDGKAQGAQFTLAREMLFPEDYRVAVLVTPTQAGCLYILNEGPLADGSISINVLSPRPGDSARLAANQSAHTDWFAFDKAAGPETMYLVWSENPVPDFEKIKDDRASLEHDTVAIKDPQRIANLQHVLSELRIPESRVRKEEGAKRTVLTSDKLVLVHAIRLEHH
jgi:class 3 adenylate cyclase